jgi:uncharacterized protein (DUF1697 family)
MGDLRAMANDLKLATPRTFGATGNLVFECEGRPTSELEDRLEDAFEARFERRVDIIVRSADAWRASVAANPFPTESLRNGSLVLLRTMRKPLPDSVLADLRSYLGADESVALAGGDLWASFGKQASQSRLLRALTTRRLGVGTARNWNTARNIQDLLG